VLHSVVGFFIPQWIGSRSASQQRSSPVCVASGERRWMLEEDAPPFGSLRSGSLLGASCKEQPVPACVAAHNARNVPILNCLGVFCHTDMGPRLTRRRLTLLPNAIRKMALLPSACGEKKLTTSSS